MVTRLMTLALICSACGVIEDVSPDEVDQVENDLRAEGLAVAPLELDLFPGTGDGFVSVLTSANETSALFGPGLPALNFARNWVVAYRPEAKSPTSRVTLTKAQLSGTGKTLTLWATVTEPGAGCQSWRPNGVSAVQVQSRTVVPTRVRVRVTNETESCGRIIGPRCSAQGACPTATPWCQTGFERRNGERVPSVCVSVPVLDVTGPCNNDSACGPVGFCAGLSFGSGSGQCQPRWMRGTFSTAPAASVAISRDGSWRQVALPVSGLATVPVDGWLQLYLEGASAQAIARVQWRLFNPAGTAASNGVAVAQRSVTTPVVVPSDEVVNGEWVLEVRDTGTSGPPVQLRAARLSLTSRFD